MSLTIATAADERAFSAYKEAREQPRVFVARVYNNCTRLIDEYAKLSERLADSDDLGEYATYHAEVMGEVAPHVQNIIGHVQGIIATVEAIEQAAPGTFGVTLPEPEEPEPSSEDDG